MIFRRFVILGAFVLLAVGGAAAFAADLAAEWQNDVVLALRASSTGDNETAEQIFLKALKETDKFAPGDARIGTTWNYLGLVYKEEQKYPEAERAFQKALVILQKADGMDSLDVGNVNYNIATVLMAESRWDPALPYIEASRAVYEKILGPASLKATATYCMVGDVYRNLLKYYLAEAPLKQCAAAREAAGGMLNPELADALSSLGLVYEHEGKLAVGDQVLKLVEKIRETTAGVTSAQFADALEAHAALLRMMGRGQDAEKDESMAGAVRRYLKRPK